MHVCGCLLGGVECVCVAVCPYLCVSGYECLYGVYVCFFGYVSVWVCVSVSVCVFLCVTISPGWMGCNHNISTEFSINMRIILLIAKSVLTIHIRTKTFLRNIFDVTKFSYKLSVHSSTLSNPRNIIAPNFQNSKKI